MCLPGLLLLGGCQSDERLVLDLPALEGAKSVLVALTVDDELQWVMASELDSTTVVREVTDISRTSRAQVEILAFEETLAERGIEAGLLSSDPDGRSVSQIASETGHLYVSLVQDGQPSSWQESSMTSQTFGNFRIKAKLVEQIDLFKIHHFDNMARSTSLKLLEFNMRLASVKDLPFPVGSTLTRDQVVMLKEYNLTPAELLA